MNLMNSEQTLGQKLRGSRRRLVQGRWWICPVSVAYSTLFCRSGSGPTRPHGTNPTRTASLVHHGTSDG